MLQFDIITIFPEIFNSFLKESLVNKAIKKKLIKVNIHNLRDYTKDTHRTTDDKPFGGGRGMVLKIDPIFRSVQHLKNKSKNKKIVLFTSRGQKFNQKTAYQFSKLELSNRYTRYDNRNNYQ